MTTSVLVAVGVATVWLLVLTVVVMMCVRQLGAVIVRIELVARGGGGSYAHGASVGFRLTDHLVSRYPDLGRGRRAVVLVSSTCVTCAGLIEDFRAPHTLAAMTLPEELIALIVGSDHEQVDYIEQMLEGTAKTFRDPAATDIARGLRLANVPSALLLDDGIITGSLVFIDRVAQLDDLVAAADRVGDGMPDVRPAISATR